MKFAISANKTAVLLAFGTPGHSATDYPHELLCGVVDHAKLCPGDRVAPSTQVKLYCGTCKTWFLPEAALFVIMDGHSAYELLKVQVEASDFTWLQYPDWVVVRDNAAAFRKTFDSLHRAAIIEKVYLTYEMGTKDEGFVKALGLDDVRGVFVKACIHGDSGLPMAIDKEWNTTVSPDTDREFGMRIQGILSRVVYAVAETQGLLARARLLLAAPRH